MPDAMNDGVRIHYERPRKGFANRRHVRCKLAHRHQADVGDAEKRIGDAGAGDVGGRKALIGDDARRERIGDTGQQQRRAWDKHVAQFMARHVAHHCSVLCRFFERADLLYHDGFVLAGRADPDKKHANVCGFGQAAGDTATGALE